MKILALILALLTTPALADDTVYFTATMPDGSVTVVVGAPKEQLVGKLIPVDATDEDYAAYVLDQASLDKVGDEWITCKTPGVTCERMPDDWWPPFDRRLRNAWEKLPDVAQAGNFTDMGQPMRGLGINMGKAKGIWKAQMERAAIAEASVLDDEIAKADLRGDNQGKAVAQQKRNALNGIMNRNQAALDAATTPEQLMAVWPTELETRRPKAPDMTEVQSRRSDRAK